MKTVLVTVVAGAVVGVAGAYAFGSDGADKAPVRAASTGASATPGAAGSGSPEPSPSAPVQGSAPPSPASPPASPATSASPAKPVNTSGCEQGDKQREVEEYLAKIGTFGQVDVDGAQSDVDCAAIKKFQQRFGISPASGRAGPTTVDVARRISSVDYARCGDTSGLVVCVDLTLQVMWVSRDGKVELGPTVVRTGMGGGYQTPAGNYKITEKVIDEWSKPYKVVLPYWQRFVGDMGFQETPSYIHDSYG